MDLGGFDAPGFDSQALQPSQANQQAVEVMKKKHNSLASWLPTIGAIGGGLLTAPLEALDAVSGVGGTALNIAGASAGSAFGKFLQNKIEGNPGGNGVLGAGAEGALGQGIGLGAGKLLGATSKVASNYGTDLLSSVGGRIPKSEARAYQLRNTTDALANYGVKPKEFADVAGKVTGQNGVLTKLTRQAIGQAGPVDTEGIDSLTKELLANEPLLSGNAETKVTKVITNGLDNLNGRGAGYSAKGPALTKATAAGTNDILNTGAHPLDTFDFIKQLESKAATLTGNGKNPLGISDEAKATANVYKGVADELKDRLFTGSGADNIVANHLITPDVVNELQAIRPGDKNWGQFVQKVMGSQTIGDLRHAQSPFVKAGQIQAAKEAGLQGGSGAGPILKGALDLGGLGLAVPTSGASLVPALVAHTLTTDTGKTIAGNLLRDPFGKVPGAVSDITSKMASAAPQVLTHLPDFTDPNTAMPQQSNQGGGDLTGQLGDFASVNSSLINGDQTQNAGPGLSGYTDDELQQGIARAVGAGDIKAATEIQNLLKINQSSKSGANAPLGQVQKRQLAQINTAVDRLQRVSKDYSSFGIGNGPLGILGGKLEALKGKAGLNNNVKAYNDQLSDVAFEIAKALSGGSAAVSDVRVKQIERGLPTLNDTHDSATKKINNLLNDLLSAQKEFVSVPSASGDNVANPNDYTGSTQGFSSNPANVQFAQ